MKRNWRSQTVVGLWTALVVLAVSAAALAQAPTVPTPTPSSAGPIAVAADSYPLAGVKRTQERVDLEAAGYVEEEFFVTGTGNAYDWAPDGGLTVQASGIPYTTRILVRRPSDPTRFSGNVIVEPQNNTRAYDWPMSWGLLYPYILESGHAYVGVTYRARGIDTLKAFNPTRYATVKYGATAEACTGRPNAERRDDVRWDILSQVGALLKNKAASGPLAGFNVQRLYMVTHEGDIVTYVNAVHSHAKLANGRPVYDGYLNNREASASPINACAAPLKAGDARREDHGADVPVVRMVDEGDVLDSLELRRPDSDAPGNLYRYYEVPGAPHMDASYYRHMPVVEDQVKVGQQPFVSAWPLAYGCDINIPLQDHPLFRYAVSAALDNIDRWVREGVPAPKAERLAVRGAGQKSELVLDKFGNATGGIRSPYLDVPTATYHPKTPGPAVCANLLHIDRFDWARMQSLYGSPQQYAKKVAEIVDRLVEQRWLRQSDGKKIKQEALGSSSGRTN
jgi:hypothetical protein